MTPTDRLGRGRRLLAAVVVALAVWAAAQAPSTADAVARADDLLWELALRLVGPRPPPAELVVVRVDDADVAAFGGWPLDRGRWADLVARLDAAGAATIVLDVLVQRSAAGVLADAPLASAMARHGNVLLPVGVTPATDDGAVDPLARTLAYDLVAGRPAPAPAPAPAGDANVHRLVPPAPALRAAAAALGPSAVAIDPDGGPPALRAGLAVGETVIPALAVEAVRRHRGVRRDMLWFDPHRGAIVAGAALAPAQAGRYRLLAYGPAGHVPTLGAREVVADPPALAGKLVVVGVDALAAGERFRTAFAPALSGTELLATGIGNLLEGRALRSVPPASVLGLALTLAAAVLAAFAVGRGGAATALLVLLVALAGLGGLAGALLARADWWLPAAPMAAALLLAAVAVEAIRLVQVQRAERAFADAQRHLARFFPPHVAERLAAAPDAHALDRVLEATILFVDVVDSSALVEGRPPAAAMAELRRLAAKVEAAVFAEEGTLVAFLGDGALAAFGAPDTRPDAPEAALRAARRLVAAFADDPLAIGIGLHHGEVLAGIGGGERQLQFTVIGDTVHVASRLEHLTRTLDAAIVASTAVTARVTDPLLLAGFERHGDVTLRGRDAPLDVVVLPRRALKSTKQKWC